MSNSRTPASSALYREIREKAEEIVSRRGPMLGAEDLAPGIFRGMLAGGAQALAVIREDGRIAVREAEPWA